MYIFFKFCYNICVLLYFISGSENVFESFCSSFFKKQFRTQSKNLPDNEISNDDKLNDNFVSNATDEIKGLSTDVSHKAKSKKKVKKIEVVEETTSAVVEDIATKDISLNNKTNIEEVPGSNIQKTKTKNKKRIASDDVEDNVRRVTEDVVVNKSDKRVRKARNLDA